MKRILLIGLLGILSSCTYQSFSPDDWSVDPELEVNLLSVEMRWDNPSVTIEVRTNYKEFDAQSSASWCRVTPDIDRKCVQLSVDKNLGKDARSCVVSVSIHRGNNKAVKEVSVIQRGGESEVINGIDVHWDSSISKETRSVVSGIIANMVVVRGGTFFMGAQCKDPNANNYVSKDYSVATLYTEPVHKVTLSDYYICKFELTQNEWTALIEDNPSSFVGGRLPVDGVRFQQAEMLTSRLSELTGLSFSLPTEAQWEYAARGGAYSLGYCFPGSSNLGDVGFADISLPVSSALYTTYIGGQYLANELGLYDMAGNVAELCYDFFGDYSDADVVNPSGPVSGVLHVCRGGSFNSSLYDCLVFSRTAVVSKIIGVRLVINK